AAAHVQEVGWLRSVKLDDVHGCHGQAGAIDHAANLAIQLDVGKIVSGGFDLHRIFFIQVAQFDNVRVPEQGVVVKVQLGIQADDVAVLRDNQRIDLQQAHVLGQKGVVEPPDNLADLLGLSALQAQC